MTTISAAAAMFERKAVAKGLGVRRESSPISDTVYVVTTAPTGAWTARVRISDHPLPGRVRGPLEIRTSDTEAAIDGLVDSLT